MNRREHWITWGLTLLAAILAAIAAGRPITIPPPPIPAPPSESPTIPPPQEPKPDPLAAIIRISKTGTGCSATIIGPKRPDNRYWVLSAAHCTQRVGERWGGRFRDDRTLGLVVVSVDRKADVCWMLTDLADSNTNLPYAILAERIPPRGTPVWHAGFGIDQPGNVEAGELTNPQPNADNQLEYLLSVSSGDSGGGIVDKTTGHILGPVCCTTAPGRKARVWAASPEACRQAQKVSLVLDEWEPFPIPIKTNDHHDNR